MHRVRRGMGREETVDRVADRARRYSSLREHIDARRALRLGRIQGGGNAVPDRVLRLSCVRVLRSERIEVIALLLITTAALLWICTLLACAWIEKNGSEFRIGGVK